MIGGFGVRHPRPLVCGDFLAAFLYILGEHRHCLTSPQNVNHPHVIRARTARHKYDGIRRNWYSHSLVIDQCEAKRSSLEAKSLSG